MVKKVLVLFVVFLSFIAKAQVESKEHKANTLFVQAFEMYSNGSYSTALALFTKLDQQYDVQSLKLKTSFYIALTSCHLKLSNAKYLLNGFLSEYPNSNYRNTALYWLGNLAFEEGDYKEAMGYFDSIKEQTIDKHYRARFWFNHAYTKFKEGDLKGAKLLFEKAKKTQEYESKSRFYIAYIAYEQGEYNLAKQLFSLPFQEKSLEVKSSYFKSDIQYREGEYKKAIESALTYLPGATTNEAIILNKIIGESYFQIKQYKEAINYLLTYKESTTSWKNIDSYRLGYSYYQIDEFEKAVSLFNKIVDGKDELAQNAYYQLGACYMKLDRKQEALNAFRVAYQLGFSEGLTESAHYNYAKISYEIGNPYEGVINALAQFVTRYPNSTKQKEIKSLLVNSYVETNDFETALIMIEKQPELASNTIAQQVNFLKAMDLYSTGDYTLVIGFLENAIQYLPSSTLAARCLFWKSETYFQQGNYQLAMQELLKLQNHSSRSSIVETDLIPYQRAYVYFNTARYKESASSFEEFLSFEKRGSKLFIDALLRLAESYYLNSDYKNAIVKYNSVLDFPAAACDYAAFRKALSYGLLQDYETKINLLQNWLNDYKGSSIEDEIVFNLAIAYTQQNNSNKAIETYDQLIEAYPTSIWLSSAMLRKGLLLYSKGDNTLALEQFVRLTKEFPRTEEAISAVSAAKRIYMEQGEIELYSRWVSGLDYISETEESLDQSSFESAKQLLARANFDKAIRSYEYYIENFPKGKYQLESRYDLAGLYEKNELGEKALDLYAQLVDQPSMYREESLVRKIDLTIKYQSAASAIEDLKLLEKVANRSQNEVFAISNLMKVYYQADDFSKAKQYAQKITVLDGVDVGIINDAQLILARSSFKLNENSQSEKFYLELVASNSAEIAAESLYYLALFKYLDKSYLDSNELIQKLAKQYPSYKKWAAKGLVLMAQNFIALDDSFQANYILKSVRDNFTQYPEIVSEAEMLLGSVEADLNRINKSTTKDSIQ